MFERDMGTGPEGIIQSFNMFQQTRQTWSYRDRLGLFCVSFLENSIFWCVGIRIMPTLNWHISKEQVLL